MTTSGDIRNARALISPFLEKTPLIYSDSLSAITGAEVYLKCENLQKTGSFKVRGAFNKLLNIGKKGVVRPPDKGNSRMAVAASMGNHAQGVAYAASTLGMKALIVMPEGASIAKENAVRAYGAEVMLYGKSLKEALAYAVSQKGYEFIHPFDDEDVIAGQGTIGAELMEELDDIDFIIVPVGGGGLISGIAAYAKSESPETKIIGAQTESAVSAVQSFGKRKAVDYPASPTLADGIAVGRVGAKTLPLMNKYVDEIRAVKESSIAKAILLFLERKKLLVEGAGAVPLALMLEEESRFKGKRVVLIISGGNIDFTLMDRIIHRGLIENGRLGIFEAVLDDAPGELNKITGIIASKRCNIIDISHERLSLPIGKARVRVTLETKNSAQFDDVIKDIRAAGMEVN